MRFDQYVATKLNTEAKDVVGAINEIYAEAQGNIDIDAFLETVHGVGAVIMTDTLNGYPSVGTWQLLPPGVTVVSADSEFAAGSTGGTVEKILIKHDHELEPHKHERPSGGAEEQWGSDSTGYGWYWPADAWAFSIAYEVTDVVVEVAGSSATALNVGPSRACYMYERIA